MTKDIRNKREIQNRWYTKDGKRKRVPKALEPFRSEITFPIDIIIITTKLRKKYNLTLSDAVNLTVYLVGVFDNQTRLPKIFTEERSDAGALIFDRLSWDG